MEDSVHGILWWKHGTDKINSIICNNVTDTVSGTSRSNTSGLENLLSEP